MSTPSISGTGSTTGQARPSVCFEHPHSLPQEKNNFGTLWIGQESFRILLDGTTWNTRQRIEGHIEKLSPQKQAEFAVQLKLFIKTKTPIIYEESGVECEDNETHVGDVEGLLWDFNLKDSEIQQAKKLERDFFEFLGIRHALVKDLNLNHPEEIKEVMNKLKEKGDSLSGRAYDLYRSFLGSPFGERMKSLSEHVGFLTSINLRELEKPVAISQDDRKESENLPPNAKKV